MEMMHLMCTLASEPNMMITWLITARCSWLKPCWPGTCYDANNSTSSCTCSAGFKLNNSSGQTVCDCKLFYLWL